MKWNIFAVVITITLVKINIIGMIITGFNWYGMIAIITALLGFIFYLLSRDKVW